MLPHGQLGVELEMREAVEMRVMPKDAVDVPVVLEIMVYLSL